MPEALPRVTATRYVAALREGGALPGLLEADDDGLYVTRFRGAGQGAGALVAEVVAGVVTGDAEAGALARLPPSERFGWVVAPSSTVIQPSEVHTGLTDDPGATLERLLRTLVAH